MSDKLEIPELSEKFRNEMLDWIVDNDIKPHDLWIYLNKVAGLSTRVTISKDLNGLGGSLSFESLLDCLAGFEKSTALEIERVMGDGYDGYDFLVMFFQTWLRLMTIVRVRYKEYE